MRSIRGDAKEKMAWDCSEDTNVHLIYGDLGEMLKLKSFWAVGSGQSKSELFP